MDQLLLLFLHGLDHLVAPVAVLHHVQAFVFGAHTAEQRMQIDLLGAFIGPFDPVSRRRGTCRSTAARGP